MTASGKTPAHAQGSLLAPFARWILTDKLDDFTNEQLRVSVALNLPILKQFSEYSSSELLKLSRPTNIEFLEYLSENRQEEYIRISMQRWVNNQLPLLVQSKGLTADDILLVGQMRKKSFLKFATEYCTNTEQILQLIMEIDDFILDLDRASTNTFLSLLKDDLKKEHHVNRMIAETTPGIIIINDVNEEQNIYANRKLTEFLGYTPEDIQAKGNRVREDLIHPQDLEMVKEHAQLFLDTIDDGDVRTVDYRIKNKKGNYVWMRAYESVFKRNSAGKIEQKITIAFKVDKEKKIKEQLLVREAQLLEAQELADVGSFEWYFSDREKTTMTPQLLKIFEMDGVGKLEEFLESVHPDDQQKVKDAIKNAMQSGIYECDYRYNKSGKSKVLSSKGKVVFVDGSAVSMHGTVLDVTEREMLISNLRKSDELYKQAQALSHIGNWSWNLGESKLTWSDEMYRIYGLEPQSIDMSYEFIRSFNHPEDQVMITSTVNNSIDTQSESDFYYRIVLKDGSVKTVHAKGSMEKDAGGKGLRMFGTLQDVTRQKEIEKQLLEAEKILSEKNRELRQSNANLEEFAYIASHDLKEPLRKISILGDKLQSLEKDSLSERGRELLGKMVDGSLRMQTMITDLLSVSTITGDKTFQTCNLQKILDEVRETLEYKIEMHKAQIVSTALPEAVVNVPQFRQLFQNLISNSIKFAKKDVAPCIEITHDFIHAKDVKEIPELRNMKLSKAGEYLRIRFSDNCIGFENEYASKIFSIFQRLHGKSAYEGTGIGLAICKKILENHNGAIFAEGRPDEGSVFTVILPMK